VNRQCYTFVWRLNYFALLPIIKKKTGNYFPGQGHMNDPGDRIACVQEEQEGRQV
jgi:hypothetical protein